MINMNEITASLRDIYGIKQGQHICMTIMPGILADFQKMVKAAPAGQTVREEYRTEDGKAVIEMSGSRSAAGEISLSAKVRAC